MMDKSKFLEGLIETVLIPGKLEEFATQVTLVAPGDVGTIYGYDKLTGLLKDIITEKDPAQKMAKSRVLLDAVKVSSVLYSDIMDYTGFKTVTSDMPNIVNRDNPEAKIKYIKDDIKGLPNEHGNYTKAMTTNLKQLNKTGINPAMFSEAQMVYLQGIMDANFAGGPGIQVQEGPAISSVPASVQPESEHVKVFAEDIKQGDTYNGRKIMAVTEEISPVDGTTLYSIELDDRSTLKASAGTQVTFSVLDYIINNSDNIRENDMTNKAMNYSVERAVADYQKGLRTYSENFSIIFDYHASEDGFDSDEYLLAFDELEKMEEADPVNQITKKLDELDSKVELVLASQENDSEEDFDDIDKEDYAEFEDELDEDASAEAFSDFMDNFESLEYDEETGMVFGEFEGDTFVFNDNEEIILVLNKETDQLEHFANYGDLSLPESEDMENFNQSLAGKWGHPAAGSGKYCMICRTTH